MNYRWAWLAVGLLGCGGGSHTASDAGEVGLDDVGMDMGTLLDVGSEPLDVASARPDTFDPFCHYDCFRAMQCVDGVVWEQVHAPVPCGAWTGSCPRVMRGTCEEGCADRIPTTPGWMPSPEWTLYCEEGEARRVGDPCESDADCQQPEPPPTEPLGRNYLACDVATSMCAAIEAPVVPTDGCTADLSALFVPDRGSAYGVVRDASCASGLCRFSARGSATECDRHVCALPCTNDWDCPRTHRCEEFRDWTGRTLSEGALGSHSICREMSDADLVCR